MGRKSSHPNMREVGYAGSDFVVYDDLQGSTGRTRLGASAPTWRNTDHGITSGVTFDVLGFAVNNYIFLDLQSKHKMKLSSILDVHIHWSTDGTAYVADTSDRIKFQLDVIAAPIAGDWTVPSGSPFSVELQMTDEDELSHNMLDIADIPAINTTVSTIYKLKLTRVAASANDYAGEIMIHYIDCHYQIDTAGSLQENSKI